MATLFLAKMFGFYLVIIALALLIRGDEFRLNMQAAMRIPGLLQILSVFILFFGIALVLIHNVWVVGWPVLVTLLCWITLLKGIGGVLAPDLMERSAEFFDRPLHMKIAAVANLVLGLLLLAFGFAIL